MANKKRIISLAVAVAVLFVMLCSTLFIAAEASHVCAGEDCPICYQISVCESTLGKLCLALCATAFVAAFIYTLRRSISACVYAIQNYTLISLKVKLTD